MTVQDTPTDMSAAMSQTIASVRDRFVASLDEKILDFETLRQQLASPADRKPALKTIRYETHKIAGIAETIGFGDIGTRAASIEEMAEAELTGAAGGQDAHGIEAALEAFLDRLEQVLEGGPAPS